uniref:Uncharacterized protein n=6 Tax=Haematobia irritans TaxID=7368 RepID=A0A1L8E6N4_HAEIR
MFGVGDSITNNVFQKHLEDTTGFFVYQSRDTFYTATTSQTSDCRLGNTLDVITQHFTMTFSATFSQAFATFTTTSHFSLFFF